MSLKGFNLGGWLSQNKRDYDHMDEFITGADFRRLKDWGSNAVRIPFDGYLVLDSSSPLSFNSVGIEYLKLAYAWCREYDLVPIFDFHITPWHYFNDREKNQAAFFDNPEAQKAHIETLAVVFDEFKDKEDVYIEILNEPFAAQNSDVDRFYRNAIETLRKRGFKNPLIIEPNNFSKVKNLDHLKEFTSYKNIVYSFHFYEPEEFTHQKTPWTGGLYPDRMTYPYRNGDRLIGKQTVESLLAPAVEFRDKYNVELFCGEFGAYLEAPGESRYRWISDVTEFFQANDLGWFYWNYKNMDFGIINDEPKFRSLPEYNNPWHTDFNLLNILTKYSNVNNIKRRLFQMPYAS